MDELHCCWLWRFSEKEIMRTTNRLINHVDSKFKGLSSAMAGRWSSKYIIARDQYGGFDSKA